MNDTIQENNNDRSLEVSENVELLWGNIICNSPLVIKHNILNTRAHIILSKLQSFASDLQVYKASQNIKP